MLAAARMRAARSAGGQAARRVFLTRDRLTAPQGCGGGLAAGGVKGGFPGWIGGAGARKMATFTVGDEAWVEAEVCEANTAITMKSGSLPVFATPSMVALMEEAACKVLQAGLDAEETTVGTKMDVSHDAASGLGSKIKAFARVDEVDGKMTTLLVWAQDEAGIIGRGMHERATVKGERLVAKAKERLHGGLSCPQ